MTHWGYGSVTKVPIFPKMSAATVTIGFTSRHVRGTTREVWGTGMLDRGISFRCMLVWSVFVSASVLGAVSLVLRDDGVGRVAMILAAIGFVQVVLNDNAKTRRVIRVAAREVLDAQEGGNLTRLR